MEGFCFLITNNSYILFVVYQGRDYLMGLKSFWFDPSGLLALVTEEGPGWKGQVFLNLALLVSILKEPSTGI